MQNVEVPLSVDAFDALKFIARYMGRMRHREIIYYIARTYAKHFRRTQGLDAFIEPRSDDTKTRKVIVDESTTSLLVRRVIPRMKKFGWGGAADNVGAALDYIIIAFVDVLFAPYFEWRQQEERERFERDLRDFTRKRREAAIKS